MNSGGEVPRKKVPFSVILLCPLLVIAQSVSPFPERMRSGDEQPTAFRADSTLALVPFQVIAKGEGPVANLQKEEVELREDGVPQKIVLFEGGRFYPRISKTEVHLLFDCSGSVRNARALNPKVFRSTLLDEFPNVKLAIWGFSGDTLSRFTSPTRDPAILSGATEKVRRMPADFTPLYRSLRAVAQELEAAPGDAVRIIVVISDGIATPELAKADDAVAAARAGGIPVFPVLVNAHPSQGVGLVAVGRLVTAAGAVSSIEILQSAFTALGGATGGRAFEFKGRGPGDLVHRILTHIAGEIRDEYVAGYNPTHNGQHTKHRVEIVLKNANRGNLVGGIRDVEY
jgi:Ca-activated chloride channel family protein